MSPDALDCRLVETSLSRQSLSLPLGEDRFCRTFRVAGQTYDHVRGQFPLIPQMLIVGGIEIKANPTGFGFGNLGAKMMADFVAKGCPDRQGVMGAVDENQRLGQGCLRPIQVET